MVAVSFDTKVEMDLFLLSNKSVEGEALVFPTSRP
jgi:hypothetical protein